MEFSILSLSLLCFRAYSLPLRCLSTQQPVQPCCSSNWSHYSTAQTCPSLLKLSKSQTGPGDPQGTTTTVSDFISYQGSLPLVHQAAVTPVSLHHKAPQRPQFYSLDSRNPCQMFAWLILTCLSSQWMFPACPFIVHFPLPSIPDLSHPVLLLLMQQMQADCCWSVSITSSPPEQGDSLFTNVSQTRTRVTLNAFKASE